MFHRFSALGLVAGICALALPHAQAARPMQTDDARIVDDKACQLESWVRRNQDSSEYWAMPACAFGNFELTVGGAELRQQGGDIHRDLLLQGKTLLKPLTSDGWGLGFTLGNQRKGSDIGGSSLAGDLYLNLPATFAYRNDQLLFHANLGWLREKASRHQHTTWGLSAETAVTQSTWLIAETFANDGGKPFVQLGMRQWIVQDRVQLDATWGDRIHGTGERWISIGLRLLSPPFLP
ncbi:hypothetical protein [Denitratisoma sp. agr-D3]